ncbi:MAG TPA: hypothetical protein VN812_19245 [Candidatus Acidoferrales bacterium]|nr:hypothetical protein [Candidatus Acidoferrales bacterium]
MGTILDLFIAAGVSQVKVERFLDADPKGAGTIRDQIAADMANQLLEALGQRGRQSAAEVKRIRARGGWTGLDRRPPD